MHTFESKFAKSANPVDDPVKLLILLLSPIDCWTAKGSEFAFANGSGVGDGVGGAGTGAALKDPVGPCDGRGGAGRGGGCLAFLGGRAGLGLSGRGGAWRFANGSSPKGSFVTYMENIK